MSRDEVRAFDAWAINELGVPGIVLMENAGRSCAQFIIETLSKIKKPKVCIFCGTGNNGGDGFVIARHILNAGFAVTVVVCGNIAKIRNDARVNLDILTGLGLKIERLDMEGTDDIDSRVTKLANEANMIIDAIFGTGLTGTLRDEYKRLIESINGLGCPILSVDIPSGLDCDTGQPLDAAIKANCTVTFVAVKKGFVFENTRAYTGDIFIASIGVEPKYG
ncbi:MAG: NAD(P)H-hydrate epimerase [Planctomycetes bacterium]|nr:NAD(P)H-hydrate epimerase [Planctomycetota bacterium]